MNIIVDIVQVDQREQAEDYHVDLVLQVALAGAALIQVLYALK